MKLIRKNVFETNSSSTHVITIKKNVDRPEKKLPRIHFGIGEYGWEYDKYDLPDYIWTGICHHLPEEADKYKQKIIDILSPYFEEIEFEEPKFDIGYDEEGNQTWKYLSDGYVDHAEELDDFFEDLFADDGDLLIDAVLYGYVRTGNDNSEGYDCDENDADPRFYHYYKGN